MGEKWTWSNLREHSSSSRIDRFLITTNVLSVLHNLNQKLLSRPTSDHFPILVSSDGIQWGPIPFQIDNKWLVLDSFRKLVADPWCNSAIKGTITESPQNLNYSKLKSNLGPRRLAEKKKSELMTSSWK